MDDSGRAHSGFLTGDDLAGWTPTYEPPVTLAPAGGRSRRPGRGPRDRLCSRAADDAGRRRTGRCRRVHAMRRGGQAGDGRPRSLVRETSTTSRWTILSSTYATESAGARRGHGQLSPAAGFSGWAPAPASFPGHPGRRPPGPRRPRHRGTDRRPHRDHPRRHLPRRRGRPLGQPGLGHAAGGWLQSSPVIPDLGFASARGRRCSGWSGGCPTRWPPASAPARPSLPRWPCAAAAGPGLRHPGRRSAGAVAAVLLARPRRRRAGPAGGDRRAGLAHDHFPSSFSPAGQRPGRWSSSPASTAPSPASAPAATTSRSPAPGPSAGSAPPAATRPPGSSGPPPTPAGARGTPSGR